MKKQKMQFIILAVLLVICIGGYFIIKNTQFETAEDVTETVVITDFDTEQIKTFAVSESRNYSFEKNGDEWIETSMPDEDIDEALVDSAIYSVSYLTTTETVIEAPEDLDSYGLEEKFLTVTVTMEDDSQRILHIGDLNELLDKFYVQPDGDPNVYMVSYSALSGLIASPESFIAEEETETETETVTEEAAESSES